MLIVLPIVTFGMAYLIVDVPKPGDIRTILGEVEPAVVRIDVNSDPGSSFSQSGTGTGFVVSPDGVIVTNAHVVNAETENAAREVIVTLANGDTARGVKHGRAACSPPLPAVRGEVGFRVKRSGATESG